MYFCMYYSTCTTCVRLQKYWKAFFIIISPSFYRFIKTTLWQHQSHELQSVPMLIRRHCVDRLKSHYISHTRNYLMSLRLNDVGIRLLPHEPMVPNVVSCSKLSPYLRRNVLSIWLCLSLDRLLRCTGLKGLLILNRLLRLLRYTLLESLCLKPGWFFVLFGRD